MELLGQRELTGATGATGTANVIYSPWLNVTTVKSGSNYNATIIAAGITQDIVNKGEVLTFISFLGDSYNPIPYLDYNGTMLFLVIRPYYTIGKINLIGNFDYSSYKMRYIIIPGVVAGGRRAAVDFSDYKAVKKFYNIPD